MTPSKLPSWEATLLRRAGDARRPKVAGRLIIHAADLAAAQRAVDAEIDARSSAESQWSLRLLRPLTPDAPGTHRYEVVFAIWATVEDGVMRNDVHRLDVWAPDAATARRIAQTDVQSLERYRPAWRVRSVRRADEPEGDDRG